MYYLYTIKQQLKVEAHHKQQKKIMKTIKINSHYQHSFDAYGMELITRRGCENTKVLYINKKEAEEMAEFYKKNGIERDGFKWKVLEVNIYSAIIVC